MMALNIPGVRPFGESLMQGINTGSNLFTRLMQPVLEREKARQLEEHFAQEMGLRKQQLAQSGANSGLQRKLLEQQIIHAQHGNDPNYEFQQFNKLASMFGGGMQQGGAPSPLPTQESGEGMGMFTPEGLDGAQTAPQQLQNTGGIDFSALKQNPMLRGFFKHKFGFDPLAAPAQTPDEKNAAALDLFKQKEALRAQNKGGEIPTAPTLTQNQKAIQGIDASLPIIDELIADEDIPGITSFSPGQKAKYMAKTGGIIDTLVAAQNLPQVQASIDLVEKQIRRQMGETIHDYKNRLGDLKKDLLSKRSRSASILKNRKIDVTAPTDFSKMSYDELHKIAGGG